jgi:ubiquinone/menaquinone biosynthesis C-methylase UbiE
MTIDLYYNGKDWKDRDNIIWNDIIINKEPPKLINKIYRCYPINSLPLQYEYREIRYDKKKPNPYKVVDMIKCLYLLDWNESNNFYYKHCKKIIDNNIIKILNNQKDYLMQTLNTIKPHNNMVWLDLGCGKCKFFELIKLIYKPKKYIGIDFDSNYLAKALKYQDDNLDIVELYNINLKNNWNLDNFKWNTFNYSIKVNYIFANFSLMHFNTDIFWEELNKIVLRGTKFVFNLVKENVSWEYNNSILYTELDKVYYNFEWVHNNIQTENIINNYDILKYLIKYNWQLISINENNNNDFSKLYNWYIIEKI